MSPPSESRPRSGPARRGDTRDAVQSKRLRVKTDGSAHPSAARARPFIAHIAHPSYSARGLTLNVAIAVAATTPTAMTEATTAARSSVVHAGALGGDPCSSRQNPAAIDAGASTRSATGPIPMWSGSTVAPSTPTAAMPVSGARAAHRRRSPAVGATPRTTSSPRPTSATSASALRSPMIVIGLCARRRDAGSESSRRRPGELSA